MSPVVGQGRRRHGCPILRRSKIRAVSRVLIVVHGGMLLLATYYGTHVGERAVVISATAGLENLVDPASSHTPVSKPCESTTPHCYEFV